MKPIVVNFTKCSPKSTIASSRIATFIAQQTGGILVDNIDEARNLLDDKWSGVAFFVNGMFQFCGYRAEVIALAKRATRLFWCANDYAIRIPSPIGKIPHVRLANHDNFDQHPAHAYINWNQLTHDTTHSISSSYKPGLFYWGAFRHDRVKDFRKYLGCGVPYSVTVATSVKNREKFSKINSAIEFMGPHDCDPQSTPGAFEATIYIEDAETHRVYHSPANRYYEALTSGVLMLVDSGCLNTFRRAQIDVSPWVVTSSKDVVECLKNPGLRRSQQEKLHYPKDYKKQLVDDFLAVSRSLGLRFKPLSNS